MSKVVQIIERIRSLAGTAKDIDVALDKRHGIDRRLGIRHGDPKVRARDEVENRAETEIKAVLDGLDLDTLHRIEALMYSGRGDGSAVELRRQIAADRQSREDAVRTLLEKRASFDMYFDRGLTGAKADGIDLDTF